MKKRSIDSIDLGSQDSSSDEETDYDSGNEKDNNRKEGDDEKKENENDALLILKKKLKVGKNFSEDMLCGSEGLTRIYEEFPKVFQFRGKGHEASDLSRLTRLYKEWAFQLYSGLAFTDLLKSVHSFSTKSQVRTHMVDLRERERDRYMKEVLGVNIAAGERIRDKKYNKDKDHQKNNTEHDDGRDSPSTEKHITDNGSSNIGSEKASVLGIDDDIDLAEIEELERQAILASQLSQTKVDINTPPDVEEEEFDFEEAERALRDQEMDEAEAYLAEQEREINLQGIPAQ